jgi:hypothetical protein
MFFKKTGVLAPFIHKSSEWSLLNLRMIPVHRGTEATGAPALRRASASEFPAMSETVVAPMHLLEMAEQWTEQLRCPMCGKIGNAALSHGDDEETPSADSVPSGFEVISRKHGSGIDFMCTTCRIPVEP